MKREDFDFVVVVHGSKFLCLVFLISLSFSPLKLFNSIIPTVMTFSPLLFNILAFPVSRM